MGGENVQGITPRSLWLSPRTGFELGMDEEGYALEMPINHDRGFQRWRTDFMTSRLAYHLLEIRLYRVLTLVDQFSPVNRDQETELRFRGKQLMAVLEYVPRQRLP